MSRIKQNIISLISNSIKMTAIAVEEEEEITLGQTKIGGRPDLPSHTNWPSAHDNYLSFIAQINLEDVDAIQNDIPNVGLLSFFYDAVEQPWGIDLEERESWKVIYIEKLDRLERKEFPEEISEEVRFGTCKVELSVQTTVPSWESLTIEELNLDKHERDLYWELSDKIFEHNDSNRKIHRFLGHPDDIQGEMQLVCHIVSNGLHYVENKEYEEIKRKFIESGSESWKLLLQIDSEEDIGMMWGDGGRIYFWIHEDDLRKKNFDNLWLNLQCG